MRETEDTRLDDVRLQNLTVLAGSEAVHELLQMSLQRLPLWMSQARCAFGHGSLRDLNRAAHTIASCATNIGARRLGSLALSLESAASLDEHTSSLLDTLDRECAQTLLAIATRVFDGLEGSTG